MFDLFRSRDKAVKILLGALLVLVALSMVTYLIPSYTDPTLTSTNPVLAEIGDYKLTALEATQIFQQSTQGRIPPELMDIYFPQILDQMINERAAVYKAEQMGITVTDEEIGIGLNAMAPNYFKDGKIIDRAGFESALAAQGLTAQTIIDEMRKQLTMRKLQNVILESIVITPQEVETEYRNKYERASAEYIALSSSDFRSKATVSDEEVRQRYENTKTNYMEPEKYTFRTVVVDQAKLESSIQVTEPELRAAYNASLDNFRIGERVHARHILVSTQDKSDADKAAAKTKAEDLLKQARGGADFAELARTNSDDSGNASTGGDLGWFGRGAMVPEFDAAAFALKPGDVSPNVVQTEFGYHIIQTLEKEPARLTPFEEVRAPLEQEVRSQKIIETMQATADKLRAELAQNPANAAAIAAKYGAEVISATDHASGDPLPTLGVSPEITTALAGMQPGGVSEMLALPGERLAVAILDSKTAAHPSEFADVQAQVRDVLLNEKGDQLMKTASEEAAKRVKAGEDLAAVARSLGVSVQTGTNFARLDNVGELGPATYLEEAFTQPIGSIIGPKQVQGRTVIAKVTGRTEADMSGLAAEREELLRNLKEARARERNELWMDSVLTELIASGKVKKNQEEIQRTVAQFRQ